MNAADIDYHVALFLTPKGNPRRRVLNLGDRHYAKPHTRYGDESNTIVGYSILHPQGPTPRGAYVGSEWCVGSITLDVPEATGLGGARWQLVSSDPLHVEPSVLCSCSDHGFIREGKWVPA